MRSLVSYGFLAPPALFITLCLVGAATALVGMRAIPCPRRAARSIRSNSLVTGKRAGNFIFLPDRAARMVWFAIDLGSREFPSPVQGRYLPRGAIPAKLVPRLVSALDLLVKSKAAPVFRERLQRELKRCRFIDCPRG